MNNYLMQFQSDIIGTEIARAKNLETTALGAAFLAGLAVGYWKDLDEIKRLNETAETFTPSMNNARKEQLYKGWKKQFMRHVSLHKMKLRWKKERNNHEIF